MGTRESLGAARPITVVIFSMGTGIGWMKPTAPLGGNGAIPEWGGCIMGINNVPGASLCPLTGDSWSTYSQLSALRTATAIGGSHACPRELD